MKKSLVILFFLLIVISNFVLAEGLSEQLNTQLGETNELIENNADPSSWGEKWDYLAEEWKTIFLQNPIISSIDAFLTKISIIFRILFGVEYSLSLIVLFIIPFWIYFFDLFRGILSSLKIFGGKGSQILVSIGFTIMLAQVGFFYFLVSLIFKIIFLPETWWIRWMLFFLFMFGVGSFLGYFKKILIKKLTFWKKKKEEQKTEVAQKGTQKFFDALEDNSDED